MVRNTATSRSPNPVSVAPPPPRPPVDRDTTGDVDVSDGPQVTVEVSGDNADTGGTDTTGTDTQTGPVPWEISLTGGAAVAVPGELQGLRLAWERYGVAPWAENVLPVAALAESFVVDGEVADAIAGNAEG